LVHFSLTTGHFGMCVLYKITNSWLSFQWQCRLLRGYIISCSYWRIWSRPLLKALPLNPAGVYHPPNLLCLAWREDSWSVGRSMPRF